LCRSCNRSFCRVHALHDEHKLHSNYFTNISDDEDGNENEDDDGGGGDTDSDNESVSGSGNRSGSGSGSGSGSCSENEAVSSSGSDSGSDNESASGSGNGSCSGSGSGSENEAVISSESESVNEAVSDSDSDSENEDVSGSKRTKLEVPNKSTTVSVCERERSGRDSENEIDQSDSIREIEVNNIVSFPQSKKRRASSSATIAIHPSFENTKKQHSGTQKLQIQEFKSFVDTNKRSRQGHKAYSCTCQEHFGMPAITISATTVAGQPLKARTSGQPEFQCTSSKHQHLSNSCWLRNDRGCMLCYYTKNTNTTA